MPRRWKKQTVMFVFMMTAMTPTIFAMNKKRKWDPKLLYCEISDSSSEYDVEVAEEKQENTPSTKSSEDLETGFKPCHNSEFDTRPVVGDCYNIKDDEDFAIVLSKDINKDVEVENQNFAAVQQDKENQIAWSTHSEMHSQNDDDDLDLNEEEPHDMAQISGINKNIKRDNRRLENDGKTEDEESIHSETNDQNNDDDVPFCSDQESDNKFEEADKAPVFEGYERGYATNALVEGKTLVNRAGWEKDHLFGNRYALTRKKQQEKCGQNKDQKVVKKMNKDRFQVGSKEKIKREFQEDKMKQARKDSDRNPYITRKNTANKDRDFDVKDLKESSSSDENNSELHGNRLSKWERSRRSGRFPVEDTPVKVKKMKNENLFATFLEGADLVNYTLVNAKHKGFIDRIPVTLAADHDSGYVSWNVNAEIVVHLQLGIEIKDHSLELLKFVNDVFSRISDAETPTDYNFYFDTARDYKTWFMLAIHKQKKVSIGRKWEWEGKKTSNFEQFDVRNRCIIAKKASDGICKSLLADGFHFPPDRKNKSQKIYENDIQCALAEKFDKSVRFLLLKYTDMTETAFSFCSYDLAKDNLKSKNFVSTEEFDEEEDRYIISEDDIKKAFRNDLCESFTFMMKSKNWPERLWEYALDYQHEPSKNMLTLLLERIKTFPKAKHLEILLKKNANGKTPFFDKLLRLAQNESTFGYLADSLKNNFVRKDRARVYQCLLFSGAVKPDLNVVKFALKNDASLQEKASREDAFQIANNFCWCKEERPQEDMRNNANDRNCLHMHLKLNGKTALEIAKTLERQGLKGGSKKKSFKPIKNLLEEEQTKEKKKITTCDLLTESEHAKSDLETESEHDDDSKKRKRKKQE